MMGGKVKARIDWLQRQYLQTFGWAGVLGFVVLLLACLLHWRLLPEEQARLIASEKALLVLQQQLAQQQRMPVASSPSERLADFYLQLPEASGAAMADALQKMYAAANGQGLVLELGNYHLSTEFSDPLSRFDIVFPIRGSYPQLRRFIGQALNDNPQLALESVSFRRQSAVDPNVECQLRFGLYLRSP